MTNNEKEVNFTVRSKNMTKESSILLALNECQETIWDHMWETLPDEAVSIEDHPLYPTFQTIYAVIESLPEGLNFKNLPKET